jgi:hypothetical protein
MMTDGGNHNRRKHINIKYHHVRELVAERTIEVRWMPTAEQQADLLTKALAKQPFTHLRNTVAGHEQSEADAAAAHV